MEIMGERNFDFMVASSLLTLTGPSQELSLSQSWTCYKTMVKFEIKKTLRNFVLVTLMLGFWSQLERESLWEVWDSNFMVFGTVRNLWDLGIPAVPTFSCENTAHVFVLYS